MGFFDLFKKKVLAKENLQAVTKTASAAVKANLTGPEQLLGLFNEAQAKFKQDQDLDAVIKALESVFWKAEPALKSPKCMELLKYYLQADQVEKAKEYLAYLVEQNDLPVEEYRLAEAKILKSEKNWSAAISKYMVGYLLTAERTGKLREDKLQNDIRSSVKKQGWPEAVNAELIAMVRKHVNKKDFKEASLEADMQKFILKHA